MNTFVLIVFITNTAGSAMTTAEFDSRASCEQAVTLITDSAPWGYHHYAVCAEK